MGKNEGKERKMKWGGHMYVKEKFSITGKIERWPYIHFSTLHHPSRSICPAYKSFLMFRKLNISKDCLWCSFFFISVVKR